MLRNEGGYVVDIGHRMKELRIQYGLTQQELADRAELTNCINAKFFLHVVPHFQCENFSGKAIQNRRYVQFPIDALDFRNVRK